VLICASCGQTSPAEARFCFACGVGLDGVPAGRELRKTVTVVFSDVTGSTAIGELLDPETLRRLMQRWYEEMRAVCEAHGGRVRELIGDAVMAVFGVPIVHEDDALRAVRAAVEMREGLGTLNDELERDFGLRLRSRTGVNTGEVVVRDPDPTGALALGDAVNVAARLQGAAAPGEVLIGEATYGIVIDAVRADPVEPLVLKGKAEAVAAFQLVDVLPHAVALLRHFEMPLVGRELELAQLRQAFQRAVRERRCHLVTVFGQAGIGKSRLSQEFARSVEHEADVLTGRCLSYGKGITYWPVREIVARATGDRSVREVLEGTVDADSVADRIDSATGASTGGAVKEEIFWALRKFVEVLARGRPLVLVFEDIHWGEPTLLDLIEHLADSVRDVGVFIICLARPELLDTRPTWGGGKLNAASVLLDPLSDEESSELMAALPAHAALSPQDRASIAASAGGNALFLEQMLAMLAQREDGVGAIIVPPAIQALLVARLEQLSAEERRLLECASIEGEIFHLGGVVALLPVESRELVTARLMSLVRRELIRAEPPTLPGDEAFRFRHALIREAAYTGLPKEARSDLHERHAAWLENTLADHPGEAEELLGYHLEQAYRYRSELGLGDAKTLELAEQAGRRLASAGRLALRRGDAVAAVDLLERALYPPANEDSARLEVSLDLGSALLSAGELERSDAVLTDVIERARAAGGEHTERHAWLVRGMLRVFSRPERIDVAEALRETEASLGMLEAAGDELALTHAMLFLTTLYSCSSVVSQQEAAERALKHARRADSRLDEAWSLSVIAFALCDSPTPTDEGVRICEGLLRELKGDPLGAAQIRASLAGLLAMQGEFDNARALIARSRSEIQEFGIGTLRTMVELMGARVERLADQPQAVERTARAALEHSTRIGDSWYCVLASVELARAVCDQGRLDECLRVLDESEQHQIVPDVESLVKRAATRALALARLGRLDEAEPFARTAVECAAGTDFVDLHGNALLVMAEVLRLAGRPKEAAPLVSEAVALFNLKGNLVSAARARAVLE
jgi:class 3 adenylate cyclase/tetratricopeptide (TPR) repeat protein